MLLITFSTQSQVLQSQDLYHKVQWVHIPKTGTSFANTIFHNFTITFTNTTI